MHAYLVSVLMLAVRQLNQVRYHKVKTASSCTGRPFSASLPCGTRSALRRLQFACRALCILTQALRRRGSIVVYTI